MVVLDDSSSFVEVVMVVGIGGNSCVGGSY